MVVVFKYKIQKISHSLRGKEHPFRIGEHFFCDLFQGFLLDSADDFQHISRKEKEEGFFQHEF